MEGYTIPRQTNISLDRSCRYCRRSAHPKMFRIVCSRKTERPRVHFEIHVISSNLGKKIEHRRDNKSEGETKDYHGQRPRVMEVGKKCDLFLKQLVSGTCYISTACVRLESDEKKACLKPTLHDQSLDGHIMVCGFQQQFAVLRVIV